MKHEQHNHSLKYRCGQIGLVLFISASLTGCATLKSWFGLDESSTIQQSAESLAIEGMDEFNVGKYYTSLEKFEEIMDRYPFSPQAMLAELKAADSHYYQQNYLEAKVLYLQFEERHPTNEAIPYVMFQVGMCDFARADRIDGDTSGAREAIQSFSKLLRAYPESPYTTEANSRIQAAREFLVNHEYFVAVFYVKTKRYGEAVHRLKYLIRVYPDSAIIPKAEKLLERLVAGDPPRMGFSRWLPDLTMPDWTFWGDDDEETKAEGKKKRNN